MKKLIEYIVVAIILTVGILIAVDYTNYKHQKQLDQQTQEKDDLERKCRVLEQKLDSTEQLRVVLGNRFDSAHRVVETTLRVNQSLDSALARVPGKYKTRTVSQLETEMIKRFNASQ